MDAVRAEMKKNPLDRMNVKFLVTRGQRTIFAPFYFIYCTLTLLAYAVISGCDVAHINLSADGSTWRKSTLAWLCRLLHIPYVIHLHSGRYHTFWSSQRPVVRRHINRMFEGAGTVIVLGSIWAELVRRNTPSVAKRVIILPNATATMPQKLTMHANEPHPVHILFLGRLGANKGIPELIQALTQLSGVDSWHATLAGDGDVEEVRRSVMDLGLSERVAVPGWVDNQETEELLCTADILVLPSRGENLPMSIVEAFAHGLAVIATPVGAIPEIVEHERTGLLIPVGDVSALQEALVRVMSDKELRTCLGNAARAHHSAKLELSNYVRRLGEIWSQAAKERHVIGAPFTGKGMPL
jgi:glycosyltransferase involved in cell wall biosynthesis